MAAGDRVGTVQPGLVNAPADTGPSLQSGIDAMQKAFQAGILNYDEIMDGIKVKPLEREAKAGQFEAAIAKQKSDKANRPLREQIEKNLLEAGVATSGYDAAVEKARTGFHTPADYAELGRMKAAGDVLDAEGNLASKEAMLRKAHDLINDPEGLKAHYRESILKLGGDVSPGQTLDQLKENFKAALNQSEERTVSKMVLESRLKQMAEGGAKIPQLEGDLRKEFHGNKEVERFNVVSENFGKVKGYAAKQQNLGEEAMTPQDDMGIIFSYMKILDPGSTVREGEYATAEQTRGLFQNIWAQYNKAWEGQKLLPEQRNNFVAAADIAYAPHREQYARLRKDYTDLATRYGADPRNVVGTDQIDAAGVGMGAPAAPSAPAKPPAKPPTNAALPPGVQFIRTRDGRVLKARKLPDGSYQVVK